jgi:hypothetical protein
MVAPTSAPLIRWNGKDYTPFSMSPADNKKKKFIQLLGVIDSWTLRGRAGVGNTVAAAFPLI